MRVGVKCVAMALLGCSALMPIARAATAWAPAPSPKDLADPAPHTLSDALALAYTTNPQLTAARAKLRATDENVPAALAGWRPQVSITGNIGAAEETRKTAGTATERVNGTFQTVRHTTIAPTNRHESQATATVTQYLYRGGRTTASTHEADNAVFAERARLIAQEEQTFTDTVTAYVAVVQDTQLVAINRANETVLGGQLKAINARFHVGELTTTDVAQAQAALAQAIAQRETAEGNLQSARATFARAVGVPPPADLVPPPPLTQTIKAAEDAAEMAVANNPNVIAARFAEAQAKDAVDVAFSALAPTLSLQGSAFHSSGQSLAGLVDYGYQGVLALSMPIYQGGQEYASIRQARQSYQEAVHTREDAQRQARQLAVQAFETLYASRAAIESSRVGVHASEIALEGVEREALVGSATTQNVLIEQQNLLTAQTNLVQNVSSMITASYGLAAASGRLTARDMALNVPLYDETAYYNAVRHKLWGTGDYATNQPGR